MHTAQLATLRYRLIYRKKLRKVLVAGAGFEPATFGKNPKGEAIESCTILTTTPNELLVSVHDRMPVIVPPDKYDLWLDPEIEDFEAVKEILKPYDASRMRQYPVSTKLNNANNDDRESAARIELDSPSQARLFGRGL